MTQPTTTYPPFLQEVKDNITRVAVPHHEPPPVIRRAAASSLPSCW